MVKRFYHLETRSFRAISELDFDFGNLFLKRFAFISPLPPNSRLATCGFMDDFRKHISLLLAVAF